MLDQVEIARVLDILGNRNRRRIIELLRQKPCFVTEISDRLMLSPKAVIEHLQLMEREEILTCRLDERRRKYYYLENDISVMVSLQHQSGVSREGRNRSEHFRQMLRQLRRMVVTREELARSLDQLEHDIDQQIEGITTAAREILHDEHAVDVLIALSYYSLTPNELQELTGMPQASIKWALEEAVRQGLVQKNGEVFKI